MDSEDSIKTLLKKVQWATVPLGLLALFLFSIFVTLFEFYHFFIASQEFREAVVPHLGWVGANHYVMILFLSFLLIAVRTPQLRSCLVWLFALQMLFGVYAWLFRSGREDFGNPYLMYGEFRPVWEIAIPLCWILLLSTRSVRDYCIEKNIYT